MMKTYVALPSRTKTHDTVKLSEAEAIFLDTTVIFILTCCWVGTRLA